MSRKYRQQTKGCDFFSFSQGLVYLGKKEEEEESEVRNCNDPVEMKPGILLPRETGNPDGKWEAEQIY